MKKLLVISMLIGFSTFLFAQDIMKTSELKPGMEGTGKTIFKGTTIETFKFKVLGVLENTFAPAKDIIWVELLSPVLEEYGVMEGMSGSPLYIDGKIIGAVAFGFNFAKKPIAGVTPIEDIIKTSDYNKPIFSIDISNIEIKFDEKTVKKISRFIQDELVNRTNFSPGKDMFPIKLIPSNRGLNSSALSFFRPTFIKTNNPGISQSFPKDKVAKELLEIAPADAVSIPLIRGDFELAFSGTVTYVDGKNIYLFGHPLFNLGTVDFPMHKAEVITIFPSYMSSFKLSTTRNMVGAAVQDRFSAVQGEIGRAPYMIPLKVFLKNRNRKFSIEMINHPLITPALSFISLKSILSSEYQDLGFQSINVQGKIFIEDESNVIIEDLFCSDNPFDEFSGLVLAVNFFLMNNKEKSIKIQKMDFEIEGIETIQRTEIENVILEKNTFAPGEAVNVSIYLKKERGKSLEENVSFKAPNLSPGSVFYLLVGDKEEISKFEAKSFKTEYFPIKLNPLIRAINNLRKNNRIYFKLVTQTQGLYIKGYEYSNLPLSLQNVFLFNSTSKIQSNIKYSTISEYQLEVPAVVQGNKLFKLKIKER